jgi:hypothetical protein
VAYPLVLAVLLLLLLLLLVVMPGEVLRVLPSPCSLVPAFLLLLLLLLTRCGDQRLQAASERMLLLLVLLLLLLLLGRLICVFKRWGYCLRHTWSIGLQAIHVYFIL